MSAKPQDILRQVNASLSSAIVRLRPERMHCSNVRAEHFSHLLAQILKANEFLRESSSDVQVAESTEDVRQYQQNLQKLKHLLIDLHARLLAEKSRLQAAQSRLAAAASWADASKTAL